jgi:hypothetical protein
MTSYSAFKVGGSWFVRGSAAKLSGPHATLAIAMERVGGTADAERQVVAIVVPAPEGALRAFRTVLPSAVPEGDAPRAGAA